jgi:nucleoside-diphosphate-sugar epimerase
MPERLRVALTGAEGLIGGVVRRYLHDRYDLRPLTRTEAVFASTVVELEELDALTAALRGSDAVVHLAAASGVADVWADILASNVVGTYNLFEAARRAGVPRVVFASSNHLVGGYELEGAPAIYAGLGEGPLDERSTPRPDSLYGVSKGFGELLGRYYSDRFGIRVVCLRIGSVVPSDDPSAPAPPSVPAEIAAVWPARIRATWLSHRDCAELIARALEADVRFAIAYGVSDNPGRFWDLESARRSLGFVPHERPPD